jgi:hypothetical protein
MFKTVFSFPNEFHSKMLYHASAGYMKLMKRFPDSCDLNPLHCHVLKKWGVQNKREQFRSQELVQIVNLKSFAFQDNAQL